MTPFERIRTRAAGYSFDAQMHLVDLLADRYCQADLHEGTIRFTGKGEPLVGTIQVLGSEAIDGTWLWAWANKASGLPDAVTDVALSLFAHGQEHGIPELTTPMLPTRPDFDGAIVGAVACDGTASPGWYRLETDAGGAVYVLLAGRDAAAPDRHPAPPHVAGLSGDRAPGGPDRLAGPVRGRDRAGRRRPDPRRPPG
jgi:hypothetical protein